MPLVKTLLETQIFTLLTEMSSVTEKPEDARKKFAKDLASLIDSYVKSATITVTTTGTAAAQSGFGKIS